MQKNSRKFGTLYYLLYVCRQEEAAEIFREGNETFEKVILFP